MGEETVAGAVELWLAQDFVVHTAPGAHRREALERDEFREIALGGRRAGFRQVGVFSIGHAADEAFRARIEYSVQRLALPSIQRVLALPDSLT